MFPSLLLAVTLLLTLLALPFTKADIVIFEPWLLANSSTPVVAGEISQQCISALEATISCDPYLRTSVLGDSISFLDTATLDSLCTSTCGTSLAKYHQTVQSACGQGPELWQGTPATLYGDQIWAQYNITCFKDSKGQYCQSKLSARSLSHHVSVDHILMRLRHNCQSHIFNNRTRLLYPQPNQISPMLRVCLEAGSNYSIDTIQQLRASNGSRLGIYPIYMWRIVPDYCSTYRCEPDRDPRICAFGVSSRELHFGKDVYSCQW